MNHQRLWYSLAMRAAPPLVRHVRPGYRYRRGGQRVPAGATVARDCPTAAQERGYRDTNPETVHSFYSDERRREKRGDFRGAAEEKTI